MLGIAAIIASIATFITAIATLIGVVKVRGEVKTANGITMAALADRAEGRRIEADVPEADRTHSEAEYVTRLNK